MRRQSGYEDDWIRALNEAGNLANTLSRTKAMGLQTHITEQEVADKQRKEAIANAMTTGLSRGERPETLSKTSSVPGAAPGWTESFNQVNAGLKPGDKDYVPADGFTRSSDIVGSAEVQAGLNEATRQRAEMFKSSEDAKTEEAYKQLSSVPIEKILASDEVKTGDYSRHGDNASAMARAYAKVLSEYSKVPEVAKKINEDRAALVSNLYSEFQSRMGLASEYFKKGMRDEGKTVLRDIIDKSILAYKTEETPDGKIKLKITTAGEDAVSDKAYEPEELFSELLKIGQREFAVNTFAAMEHKRQLNEGKVEYLVDKNGNVMTAKPMFDIKSNDNRWYVTINGRQVGRANLEDFITEYGFKNVKNKELEDAGTRRGLAIQSDKASLANEKKRGLLIDEQTRATRTRAANGGGSGGGGNKPPKENIQVLKDRRAQATKALAQELWANGIDVKYNPDTGDIDPGEEVMLTQAKRDKAAAIAAKHGFNAAFRPVEGGIDNGWFSKNTTGYKFGGVSGYGSQPDSAMGLQRNQGHDSANSGAAMSREEFDAAVTGEKPPGKQEKKSGGLWKSLVPKDSALNYVDEAIVDGTGFKSAKKVAAGVKDTVKGGAKVLGLTGRALSLSAEIGALKNQLTYEPENKEIISRIKAAESELRGLTQGKQDRKGK